MLNRFLLSFALLVLAPACVPAQAQRAVYNFNPGWKLTVGDPESASAPGFDDASWKAVTLPRAWNEDDAFSRDIVDHATGIAWYRKRFTLPGSPLGRKVFIEFEGARQAAEVYVNGTAVGLHENGVTAFGFDLTPHLHRGENVIAVRTDNRWEYKEKSTGSRYQWADKNFNANYGGLPKNVRLHVTDKLYQTLPLYSNLGTTGVYVYAREFDLAGRRATVHAESEVRNEYLEPRTFSYEVTVKDKDGRRVASFCTPGQTIGPGETRVVRASARISRLNFWSWGYGYLYDVVTTLKIDGKPVDSVVTRTGFRQTSFVGGEVRLNGRALQLKGYAQRTSNEWPAIGISVPAWLSDYSNGKMLASNANVVRWMHVTPWKQDVESFDRIGLIQAMPAGDAEKDAVGRWWGQRVEAMRDAIIYNRNSPSIVFYEAGNAGISDIHMREMKALRDKYDPQGGRAAGSREMLSSRLKEISEYGGEMLYINKSADMPVWAMEYARDEGARKFWDEYSPPFHRDGDGPLHRGQSAAAYNRNMDSHAIENVKRWFDYYRERPGTGTRVSSGGVNIIFSDSNTHYRGAENFRRSGEVDAMRIPKDGFFAHQVIWDGWVDIERPRAHIIGHWNYAPDTVKPVVVVSSADMVELFLNGKSLGYGLKSDGFIFTFNQITFRPGTLKAIGYDRTGKRICEASLVTAGAPAALKLTPIISPKGLQADGHDLALVQVEVVDKQGRRNPVALNTVRFELAGPAEWRGGIAQGPSNHILNKELPVEGGINRVLIRSSTQAGRIVLKASADGLAGTTLTLRSEAYEVIGGLGNVLPGAGLGSYLGRGPTPAGSSYTRTRIAVPVASVEAGSNALAAGASTDDDETTSWTSQSGEGRAAITYRLARAATLSEITLRLTGWRERSYPLRVLVDGEAVYEGKTPKSLGYVTLPLQARHGSLVRIELAGSADEANMNVLTEVANQKNVDTGVGRAGKDVLSIVEAEFYEALKPSTDR